ncbi:uncharacterized protein TRAVEDRAFT_52813 [Trametes versicolor FP-101664 SS1]|uniref:uncharacterized protein n=1 Tax=Trametes versicolor (strain FP-101664) TaxID=717944 RepID=UPI0004624522|nr:uncharacterized protein TRAVEDRAFT_52813 [Trametes versicolor FP-101664 SS1]EIW53694.1 hypothetical protein TRAVEDRAFT_52813 [Trametes versicolor FP-101664 SS1]
MFSEPKPDSDSGPNPPWYTFLPDGRFDPGGIPDRLLQHSELQKRGIVPTGTFKPGAVFSVKGFLENAPQFDPALVIKVLDTNGAELPIYERLLGELDRPNNHTLPSEITTVGHPLLIMPFIGSIWDLHDPYSSPRFLVDFLYQFVEGVEYLHSHHIVHMDISPHNVLLGLPSNVEVHKDIVAYRLYIIDFDIARRFKLGPGVQPAITLPDTQYPPPKGLKHFDPYSWDVYCMGLTMESIMKASRCPCFQR